ncbi:hypothetical protein [Kineococcus sp. NUM-3379]
MTSVPDFSQASAAAAVERVTPAEGEPYTDADAEVGVAGLAGEEQVAAAEPEEPDLG